MSSVSSRPFGLKSAGVCLLIGTGVAIALGLAAYARMEYLAARNVERRKATFRAMSRLQGELTLYKAAHGALPGPALGDALNALGKEGANYHEILGVPITQPGRDAWGHELVYELRDSGHAVIRSVGENGIDEGGGGDDIQMDVPTPTENSGVSKRRTVI